MQERQASRANAFEGEDLNLFQIVNSNSNPYKEFSLKKKNF